MNHIDDAQFDRTIAKMQGAISSLEPLPGQQVSEPLHSTLEWLAMLPQPDLRQMRRSLARKQMVRPVATTLKYGTRRKPA